jgi:hypothetical protein
VCYYNVFLFLTVSHAKPFYRAPSSVATLEGARLTALTYLRAVNLVLFRAFFKRFTDCYSVICALSVSFREFGVWDSKEELFNLYF